MKIIIAIIFSLVLLSCGTGKKLQLANLQIDSLKNTNAQLSQKLNAYEKDIAQLREENIAYSKEAQDCRIAKEAIRKNLMQINNALAQEGTSLRTIREKAEMSMAKFAQADVDVKYKGGLVYISMNDKLLFKSGSAVVNTVGTDALDLVAELLNEYPKLKVYIIGNTDNVPVYKKFKDNWSLSTERANAIVRVLHDKYKVDPSRLVAGGRGKYHPVADNSTEAGKASNRRTDIILNPDLSSIWEESVKK